MKLNKLQVSRTVIAQTSLQNNEQKFMNSTNKKQKCQETVNKNATKSQRQIVKCNNVAILRKAVTL